MASVQGRASLLAASILEVVPKLNIQMRKDIRDMPNRPVSVVQFRALAQIHKSCDRLSALADNLGISEPAVTKLLNLLSKRGLIQRKENFKDRRCNHLSLTKSGEKIFESVWSHLKSSLEDRLRASPPQHLVQMDAAFIALRALLDPQAERKKIS